MKHTQNSKCQGNETLRHSSTYRQKNTFWFWSKMSFGILGTSPVSIIPHHIHSRPLKTWNKAHSFLSKPLPIAFTVQVLKPQFIVPPLFPQRNKMSKCLPVAKESLISGLNQHQEVFWPDNPPNFKTHFQEFTVYYRGVF